MRHSATTGPPAPPRRSRRATPTACEGHPDGRRLGQVTTRLRPEHPIGPHRDGHPISGPPPAVGALSCNRSTTGTAAGPQRDLPAGPLHTPLVEPGAATMLGPPVDLSAHDPDSDVRTARSRPRRPGQRPGRRPTDASGPLVRLDVRSGTGRVAPAGPGARELPPGAPVPGARRLAR